MLTPLQIKSNYSSLFADSSNITGIIPPVHLSGYRCITITDKDTFTTKQWDNLVKVASIIKANENRFDMSEWHGYNECGTTHCIAGWAESLAMNDTNYSDMDDSNFVAENMLSHYVKPFFWVTDDNLGIGDNWVTDDNLGIGDNVGFNGLAEQLVMKWFIDPILEEARRESYELSNEITQFIQKAKEETQANELITA
jgi:hypothetical protein